MLKNSEFGMGNPVNCTKKRFKESVNGEQTNCSIKAFIRFSFSDVFQGPCNHVHSIDIDSEHRSTLTAYFLPGKQISVCTKTDHLIPVFASYHSINGFFQTKIDNYYQYY